MTTIGSPVYGGNSNNPLWLSTNPTSISLAGTAPLVLTNIGGVLAENGVLSAPTAQWSTYPATSNKILMDGAGNALTNSGNNLYYNGSLIANATDIQNIADWSLYNAISDLEMATIGYPTLATGGTITTANGYRTHTFTSSGTFNVVVSGGLTVSSLVVGGGGGGGSQVVGGGGGAGGAVLTTGQSLSTTSYTVVVGTGGAGGVGSANTAGTNGVSSSFNGVTGTGGGGGAAYNGSTGGAAGGCGGGGGVGNANSRPGGTGSQGFNGGAANSSGTAAGGGGGGMGGVGGTATTSVAGAGGAGQTYTLGGSSYLLAGGGGGGSDGTGGVGGTGGGGAGLGYSFGGTAGAGTANTGSGGGGAGGGASNNGGAGGSGIVIISYPISPLTPVYYSILDAKNITAISNISGGTLTASGTISGATLTSSGGVSGTTGTFTTQVITPTLISASNLSVSATSNLTNYCGTTLSNNAPTISNSFVNTYNILGDKGSDYTDYCYTNLSNKGGKGGSINLTADAGSVTISGTTYGIGGQINLTANSPLTVPYNLTSAIKLSAASILSYAGAVSPVGSLAGYNYIQGTLGVNIVAGSASSVPNTPGTIYLYGANGTKLQNSLYVDAISNYPGSNLNIHPDSSQWTDMTRVQFIGMGNNAKIDGGGSNGVISNFGAVSATTFSGASVTTSSGGTFPTILGNSITTINVPFVAGSDLTLTAQQFLGVLATSNYNINLNASSNINLTPSNGGQVYINGQIRAPSISSSSNFSITTTSNLNLTAGSNLNLNGTVLVNGSPINTTSSNWSTFPSTQALDMSNYAIVNAGVIAATGNLNLTSTNATTGFVSLVGGSNYSRIILAAGQPLNISSSNTIQLQGQSLAIYSPVDAGNNTISNVSGLTMAGNINMAGGTISNVGAVNMSNGSIVGGGNLPINATGDIRINADYQNLVPGSGLYLKVGAPGLPYHQIQAQQGQPMYLSSSNYISIGGTSTYLPSPVISQNTFSRLLSSSNVAQPVIQYGTATGSGSSGTVVVTIPAAYTGSGTYVVQVTMRDGPTAQLYATPTSGSSFTIGWSSAGAGTQNIMWTTFGT